MFSRDTVEEELKDAGCSEMLAQSLKLAELKNQHPYDLSGGEQQRLGLAMVLSGEPELLLLDEPTKGLDVEAKKQIGDYLRAYVEQGHTVLCVTHDVEFAAVYADVCSLLFEGEILSTEPVQTFFEDNAFYTTDLRRLIRGM
jgi:energy-coupling factor transporter ATP-binding protein EcfA2